MPSYLYPCTIYEYVTLSLAAAFRQPLIYLLFPHFTANHFGEIPQITSPNTANYSNKMPQITATEQRKFIK